MKSILLYTLITCILFVITSTTEAANIDTELEVYAGPGMDYVSMGTVNKKYINKAVKIENDWIEIESNGMRGYIQAKFALELCTNDIPRVVRNISQNVTLYPQIINSNVDVKLYDDAEVYRSPSNTESTEIIQTGQTVKILCIEKSKYDEYAQFEINANGRKWRAYSKISKLFSKATSLKKIKNANEHKHNKNVPLNANEYAGHSYYIFENVCKTWEEAKKYCESLGGYLAVINDDTENRVLYDMMNKQGYKSAYFGLSNVNPSGYWHWVNGDPVVYTNWNPGEPNNERGKEHYGMFYWKFKYKWNDGDFGKGTNRGGTVFICEWDANLNSNIEKQVFKPVAKVTDKIIGFPGLSAVIGAKDFIESQKALAKHDKTDSAWAQDLLQYTGDSFEFLDLLMDLVGWYISDQSKTSDKIIPGLGFAAAVSETGKAIIGLTDGEANSSDWQLLGDSIKRLGVEADKVIDPVKIGVWSPGELASAYLTANAELIKYKNKKSSKEGQSLIAKQFDLNSLDKISIGGVAPNGLINFKEHPDEKIVFDAVFLNELLWGALKDGLGDNYINELLMLYQKNHSTPSIGGR